MRSEHLPMFGRSRAAAVRWLPAALSAPLVAGLIAAVVGASIWFVGGATILMLDAQFTSIFMGVASHIPHGLLGGLLGGSITGVLLELLGFHLEEGYRA